MHKNKIQELLIDYAEGVITSEEREKMESMLAQSPGLMEELHLVRSALQGLGEIPEDPVPERYFVNFLPRLRENLDRGTAPLGWMIPSFAERIVRPAMAAAVAVVLALSYVSLQPDNSYAPMIALVQEFEIDEIASAVDDAPLRNGIVAEGLSGTDIEAEMFGIDLMQFQSEKELLAVLEDRELDAVVDVMEKQEFQEESL